MKKIMKKISIFLTIIPFINLSFNKNDGIIKSLEMGKKYGIQTNSELIKNLPRNIESLNEDQKTAIVSKMQEEEKLFAIKALIISLLKKEETCIKRLLEKIKNIGSNKNSELDVLIHSVTESVEKIYSNGFSPLKIKKIIEEINHTKRSIPEKLKLEIRISIEDAHGKVGIWDILSLFKTMIHSRM